MYQPYNYQQPTQMRPPIQPGLKGRPVSSLEEARAAGIDFDGSIFYFPDYANKKIYTKQINLDGTSSFLMYELKELPVEKTPDYVTREEFEAVIRQLTTPTPAPAAPAAANLEVPKEPLKLNF